MAAIDHSNEYYQHILQRQKEQKAIVFLDHKEEPKSKYKIYLFEASTLTSIIRNAINNAYNCKLPESGPFALLFMRKHCKSPSPMPSSATKTIATKSNASYPESTPRRHVERQQSKRHYSAKDNNRNTNKRKFNEIQINDSNSTAPPPKKPKLSQSRQRFGSSSKNPSAGMLYVFL